MALTRDAVLTKRDSASERTAAGELKSGWRVMRFDEMAQLVNDRVDNPAEAGVERYVGLEHLDPESLKIRRWGAPTDVEAQKLRFQPGDIIFGKRRAYQRKVAVADFEGICSAHAMVLRAREENVVKEFLPFFMQSDTFFDRALSISVGSLSPTINWKTLASQKFALPSKDEQRRIADVLGAADEAIIKMSDVQEAVLLTRRILIADFVTSYRRTHTLTSLGSIIDPTRPVTYGILKPGLHVEGGIPVIKVKNYPAGVIEEQDILCTSPEIEKEYRRSRLKHGDLLLSIRGTVGRIAEVPAHLEGANITQDTSRLSINANNDKNFVRALLESEFVQKQMQVATTGLAVQGINIGEVRKLMLPLPSLREQEKLASKVQALAKSTLTATRHYGALKKTKESLLRYLLDKSNRDVQ